MVALRHAGIHTEPDDTGTLNIIVPPIKAWITERPYYCDRGRWQLNAESTDPAKLTIDWADGFPRYYFHEDSLVMELATWLMTRLAQIKPTEECP